MNKFAREPKPHTKRIRNPEIPPPKHKMRACLGHNRSNRMKGAVQKVQAQ